MEKRKPTAYSVAVEILEKRHLPRTVLGVVERELKIALSYPDSYVPSSDLGGWVYDEMKDGIPFPGVLFDRKKYEDLCLLFKKDFSKKFPVEIFYYISGVKNIKVLMVRCRDMKKKEDFLTFVGVDQIPLDSFRNKHLMTPIHVVGYKKGVLLRG